MKAEDTSKITLTWCAKHKNWWVTNCPDCMVDCNEEQIKRDGIKEVVGWIKAREEHYTNPHFKFDSLWQAKLKEWGIENDNKMP